MNSLIDAVVPAIASAYYDDYTGGAAAAAFWAIYSIFIFIFAVGGYVLSSLFFMKIFEKAGVVGKWRAWVPFYNTMVFFKLGDVSPWLVFAVLLTWIPILGWLVGIGFVVVSFLVAWRVGLKLQKDPVWLVLYFFLSIVWLGILAFDKSRWNPNIAPAPWAGNGFLADRTVWDGIPVQPSATAAAPGYGAAPQGYAPPAPQGYAPPAPQGYAPPSQPGYAPPAAPAAPATGAPATPPAPPAAPPAPPAGPAAPSAPPAAPPSDPTQPPA